VAGSKTVADKQLETVTADAPPANASVREAQEFAERQVAPDGEQEPARTRRLRREARLREADITPYGPVGQLDPHQLPSNSIGFAAEDREKLAGRENERSVPPFADKYEAVVWVGGDPGRARAVELSQRAKDEPDEELLELVAATVGTDGVDVQLDAAAEQRNVELVKAANREAREQARSEGDA
jgi:hypothetical protein